MITIKKCLWIPVLLLMVQCQPKKETMNFENLDIQGHRGARGLLPENTIPAFLKAIDLGVNTLELDLAITGDNQILVSHEPYMSHKFSTAPDGSKIEESEELNHNIYEMTYDQIKKYDVGSIRQDRFPEQELMPIHKPLLSDLVEAVNAHLAKNQLPPVRYNIEIKSDPAGDSIYHPNPEEYSKLVYDFISTKMDTSMLNIQSFDFRILKYYHENYPEIKLAALVENELSIQENLDNLGFKPQVYSCYFILLDGEKVKWLQDNGIQVIPWTVNEREDIKNVLEWGVNGIISDYPNRVLEIISN